MKTYKPHISSLGDVAANLVGVLCYVLVMLFWTFGSALLLALFLLEKKSGLVRFHAVQALLFWLARTFLGGGICYEGLAAVLTGNQSYMYGPYGWMSGMEFIIPRLAIDVVLLALAVAAILRAYRWEDWRMPLIGQLAALICSRAQPAAYTGTGPVPPGCRLADADGQKTEGAAWPPAGYCAREAEATVPTGPPPRQPNAGAGRQAMIERIRRSAGGEREEGGRPHDAPRQTPQNQANEPQVAPRTGRARRLQAARTQAAANDDANGQLPRDMRDPPLPGEFLEPEPASGQTAGRGAEAAAVPTDDVAAPPLSSPWRDKQREKQPRQQGFGAWQGAVARVRGRWLAATGPQPLADDAADPNGQLPQDMRDAPPPDDMW